MKKMMIVVCCVVVIGACMQEVRVDEGVEDDVNCLCEESACVCYGAGTVIEEMEGPETEKRPPSFEEELEAKLRGC